MRLEIIYKLGFFFLLWNVSVGIAQIRPTPLGNNAYTIRMQNQYAFVARINVYNIARYHCGKNHQTYKVLKEESHYHGKSTPALAAGAIASTLLGVTQNVARSDSDNEVILKFKCVPF